MQAPQAQEYDATLKSLFGHEADKILPRLVPGTQLLPKNEKNIELDRSTLRADLVYNVVYRGHRLIMNVELQTKSDSKMHYRMLQYHVGLHAKYKLPVLSVVLYPFARQVPQPPYEEKCADEVLLTFHYKAIVLCEQDAREYVREQAIFMYTFLPAMSNADAPLLISAIHQMRDYYSQEQLRQHLVRFYRILLRSKTVSKTHKREVKEVLFMQYGRDWFIETLPEVKKLVARSEAKGKVEGKVEGKAEGLQEAIIKIVQYRFPSLVSLAQKRVSRLHVPSELDTLMQRLIVAQDEASARKLLRGMTA
ncbi:MAG: hypothetical protein E6J34_11420 [Chloroflexi bacterium]|nr:MAG: hypothetical protein E6J34_11420 [Chloroflexota bacterium]